MPAHILSPDDTLEEVLLWLHQEEAAPAPYIQAIVTQYQVSAFLHGIDLPLAFDKLLLDTVLEQVCRSLSQSYIPCVALAYFGLNVYRALTCCTTTFAVR